MDHLKQTKVILRFCTNRFVEHVADTPEVSDETEEGEVDDCSDQEENVSAPRTSEEVEPLHIPASASPSNNPLEGLKNLEKVQLQMQLALTKIQVS
ncbi:unnamed protein product [Trichobilharzia regenti]|nr:unnamed protein product [Trichobilharzia regenti]